MTFKATPKLAVPFPTRVDKQARRTLFSLLTGIIMRASVKIKAKLVNTRECLISHG